MRRRCFPGVALVAVAACRIGFDATEGDGGADDAMAMRVTVSGHVVGLTGAGLQLRLNEVETVSPGGSGYFEFATQIAVGAPYDVAIVAQPAGQVCSSSRSSGVIVGPPDVEITCFADGACPATQTFTDHGTFTMPSGCAAMIVTVDGGGGAGGSKNQGIAAAAGGNGGRAIKTLAGITAGSVYQIRIGAGGRCSSVAGTDGGYKGGGGGVSDGFGDGDAGEGTAPPGGQGGAGSMGSQPGGAGGDGGYGGGGGGGGGDKVKGNSGGGASSVSIRDSDIVVGGGGGAAGASDQNGDIAGGGGAACMGINGANGIASVAGTRSGGGGGGGGCFCMTTCDAPPTPAGGAGGAAGAGTLCGAAQDGAAGRVVISFP